MSYSSRQNTLDKIINLLEKDTVRDENLSSEVKQSFLDYAMSVITDRALPDIKDGLKPVHRRIIYSAFQENLFHDKKYKKSAALVGTVMGSYHPHGDASIYDALVRMAQSFSLRYPLIEGQGNFGSIDGDAPAAMRYTEARLSKLGGHFLDGINEECVNFVDNYDQSKKEPVILPTLIPNILINGSTGIAVGLATNIPPHNISEIVNAIVALIENPSIEDENLYEYIQGPDFPTGGEIMRRSHKSSDVKGYFKCGKGTFDIRSKIDVEQAPNKRVLLIIREIPYGVQKTKILERIVDLMKPRDKAGNALVPVLADNIVDIRDESSGDEIRVVIECRVGVPPEVIINNLYKYTQLQKPYAPNLVLLNKGEPKTNLSMREILELYVSHQLEMLVKRTEFQRAKIAKRLHILEGRLRVIDDVLEAVKLITTSDNPEEDLKERYSLTDEQQKDIFELRISRLKKLSVSDLKVEQAEKIQLEKEKIEILSSETRQREVLIEGLLKIKDEFGDARRTRVNFDDSSRIEFTELFHFTQSVFFLTKKMYISQASVDEFKIRRKGGKGVKWTDMYEDDAPMMLLSCHGKDNLLFFTNKGRVFLKRAYEMNLGQKWRLLKNMLLLEKGEKVINMISLDEQAYQSSKFFLLFVTKKGLIKKTAIKHFKKVNVNGKIAMTVKNGDELRFVIKIDEVSDICLASSSGNLVRFSASPTRMKGNSEISHFRASGRSAKGRFGMALKGRDEIVSASSSYEGHLVLSISERGYGKLSKLEDFRETSIGKKKGVIAQRTNDKTGRLLACTLVKEGDEIFLMTSSNKVNRFRINDFEIKTDDMEKPLKVLTRNTSGVILIRLEENEKVVYFTKNCEEDLASKEKEEIDE